MTPSSPSELSRKEAEPTVSEKRAQQEPTSWIAEVPKFTFAAVFVLYTFGYVIWNAHLARYGVSPPGLWKIEFFSASLCFFAIVLSISLPFALMWSRILGDRPTDFLRAGSVALYPLLLLSAFLISQVNTVFFPGTIETMSSVWFLALSAISILHLFASASIWRLGWRGKWVSILCHRMWIPGYLIGLNAISLFRSERVNAFFLFITLFLYVMATSFNGILLEDQWRSFSSPLKVVALLCAGFVMIGHALPLLLGIPPFQATNTFSYAASPQSTNSTGTLVTNYARPTNFNAAPNSPKADTKTNAGTLGSVQFWGPVSVLMRTDREIVFYVEAGSNSVPKAKLIRADQVQAIEFLNTR
jgi:hypothetical protein